MVIKLGQLKGGVTLRFMQLVVVWFLIAHWTACIWWYIGKLGFYDAEARCVATRARACRMHFFGSL